MQLNVVKLGQIDYMEALRLQEYVQAQRIRGACSDTLLLLEHPSVITMGMRGVEENLVISKKTLKEKGVHVIDSKRGGDVTYHGPGQLVGYLIMDLVEQDQDVRKFVHRIEASVMALLEGDFHIASHQGSGKYTGVFVGDKKIMAIGIGVKKKVTMHGFAFNVNTDLSHFDWIIPCGLKDKGVTSLEALTGEKQDMATIMTQLIGRLAKEFGAEIVEISKEVL